MATKKVDLSGIKKKYEEDKDKKETKREYDFSGLQNNASKNATKNTPKVPTLNTSTLKPTETKSAPKLTSGTVNSNHQSAIYRGNADRDKAKEELYAKAKARKQTYDSLSDSGKAMMDRYDGLTNKQKKTISKYRQSGKGDGTSMINGISLDNWKDMTKAMDYQSNVNQSQNRTQYNADYDTTINLEDKDKKYLNHLIKDVGEGYALDFLKSSPNAQGWEEKYGMSYDQILNAFQNQLKNEQISYGEAHPILSEIGTAIGSIPAAIQGIDSTVFNAIAPNSKLAKETEEARQEYSDTRKRYRTGAKENTGDRGDTVIDTVNAIADRALPTIAGSMLGGAVLSGVGAGGIDANQQLDILNDRPDMSEREKALSSLGHGTVEGIGTGITAGILDLPGLRNIGGNATTTAGKALSNMGRSAFNAAAENSISEAIENAMDTAIGGDNSQKEYDKLVALLNGATEEEAEKYAKKNQADRVKMAAITGAGFGGITSGIREVPSLLRGNRPQVYVPDFQNRATSDAITDAIEDNKTITPDITTRIMEEAEAQPRTVAELMAEAETNGVRPTTTEDIPLEKLANLDNEPSVPRVTDVEPEIAPNSTVPTVNSDVSKGVNPEANGNDISRSYETFKNSDLFARSEENMKALERAKDSGTFNKEVETRLKAQEDALNEYLSDKDSVKTKNLNEEWTSGKDLDTGMLVLKDALDSGDQADVNIALLKQANQRTKAGRLLRAARDYAGTKEGTLAKAESFMAEKAEQFLSRRKNADLVDGLAKKVMDGDFSALSDFDDVSIANIRNALSKGADIDDIKLMIGMYNTVGKTGISTEALDEINRLFGEIEKLPAGSRARANLEADAYKILANDIGGKRTWSELWDSWRYLAMLGNPRTHVRNIIGNTTHYMVTNIKDGLGAVIEDAVDRTNRALGGDGITRTKAILTSDDDALVEAGRIDADDVAYIRLNDGNKYTDVKSEIARARNAFNGNRPLNAMEEFNSKMLDNEDYSALKRKYARSLAGYLKANGADESIFEATDDASKALLDNAREYAIDQAKQATFHEYNAIADWLTQSSQNLKNKGTVGRIGSYIIEGLMPFKKTPMNIVKQAYKYSPLNVLSIVNDISKSADPSKIIEDVASTLTGTGIVALGAFLGSQGLLSGNQNQDYKVDNAETEQGFQNYSITIGNKSYTLDWAAPFSLPLFVGVELQKSLENGGIESDELLGALANIAEPVTEMSMLQGIQDALSQLSYGVGNALATFGANTLTGYITQGVPTIGGQIARSIDNTRRSTYSDKASGLPKQFDRAIMKAVNKVPFLASTNEPYVDYKGNVEMSQGIFSSNLGDNFGTRLLDNMVSPGYYKEGNVTPTDTELNRLYEATGSQVYPIVSDGKVGDTKLSKENFTKYQTLYGQNTSKFYDAIIQSEGYASLDDTQKASTLQDVRNFAKNIADYEIGGKTMNTDYNKAYEAYKQNGIDGVVNYYDTKIKAKSLDMTYDNYLKKEAEYEGGAKQYVQDRQDALNYGFVQKDGDPDVNNYLKAKEMVGGNTADLEAKSQLVSLGISGTKSAKSYFDAKTRVPELNPDMYAQIYNSIESNGEDGITQTEFKDFLNQGSYTQEQVNLLYNIFGGEWKKVPALNKKGNWTFVNPK